MSCLDDLTILERGLLFLGLICIYVQVDLILERPIFDKLLTILGWQLTSV